MVQYGTRRLPPIEQVDWEISSGLGDYISETSNEDSLLASSLDQARRKLECHVKRRDSRELSILEEPTEYFGRYKTKDYLKYFKY